MAQVHVVRPRRPAHDTPLVWADTILVSVAATLAVAVHAGPPIGAAVIFVFMLFYPGMPYIRLLRVGNLMFEWTLAAALSITFDVIVAELMVYTHFWSPEHGIGALVLITLAGAGAQVVAWGRRRGRGTER